MKKLLLISAIIVALTTAYAFAQMGGGMMGGQQGQMGGGMMGQGMMNKEQMNEMMQRMMPGMLPPGIKPESVPDSESRGAKLFTHYCSQCHNLPSPKMHTAEEWPAITARMFARMSMMAGMMGVENPSSEEQLIMDSYLKVHSLKSISQDMIPAPASKGAILFKATCSQCHALPNPLLHTAQEWNGVVERMRGNMKVMGRRIISDQEKKDIVTYLNDHARK